MRRICIFALAAGLLAAASATLVPAVACAQEEPAQPSSEQLIHLDTPGVLDKGQVRGRIDLRALGGDEDLVYTSLVVHLGVGRGWEGILRGSFADRKTLALPGGGGIRHGGSDVELLAKYALKLAEGVDPQRIATSGLIGVAFPSTPALGDAHLTLGLSAESPMGNGSAIFINPRAAFIANNTIIGIGVGARVRIGNRLSIVGDYTPIVSGDNTRDTTTGATKRRDVYGVAVRFSSGDRISVDLGYANGVGSTTGFGLTSGLGGCGAFYIALTARR